MIVTKIRGGLGNQLFTYAAGRALSLLHKTGLVLDTSWYTNGSRPFLLDRFNIVGEIDPADRSGAADGIGYNQTSWAYYREFANYDGYRFLSGWWQSERFFSSVTEQIREDLQMKDKCLDRRASEIRQTLLANRYDDVVAVHCRRGDYVENAKNDLFNLLPETYYKAAMGCFSWRPLFLFFSDDIAWCERTFSGPAIAFHHEEDPIAALAMMSACNHFVIANSTFSWWGAWRGEQPGTRVIAPRCTDWFGSALNEKYETHDILPGRWVTLPGSGSP